MNRKKAGRVMAVVLAAALSLSWTGRIYASDEVKVEETALTAQADYSYYAQPVIGKSGALYLTDNHTVSDLSFTTVKTRYASFDIPKGWFDQVVVRSRYIDQTGNESLYKNAVKDSYVIRFYEKNTWNKYRKKQYRSKKNASSMGEVLEIRIMNSQENDLSKWEDDPMYLHFAALKGDNRSYEVYLKHPKRAEGLIDEEFADIYRFLSDCDYRGYVISSFAANDEALTASFANTYVKTHYVDGFVPSSETVPKESESMMSAVSEKETEDEG